jgi:Putative quorum-sensing-regulated virulence factor
MGLTLTFGKYKGYAITDIPSDYLRWGINKLNLSRFSSKENYEIALAYAESASRLYSNDYLSAMEKFSFE